MPPKNRNVRKRLTEATPTDAPVLCMIRTATSTTSRLVATVHTTLDKPLADIRFQLVQLASAGGGAQQGGKIAPPVNVTKEQTAQILSARLHPFDMTSPFRFVKAGGSVTVTRTAEKATTLLDAIPEVPSLGLPRGDRFAFNPAPGLIAKKRRSTKAIDGGNINNVTPFCEAIVVLFVAQGDFGDDMQSETVLSERLMMSHDAFGRYPTPKQLSPVLNKWNANVHDYTGRTVLQEYSQEGASHVVNFLLSLTFIKVNEQDGRGDTALHLAVQRGHLEVVASLLDAGANPIAVNYLGETPLHVALNKRQDTVLELLCRRLRTQGVAHDALTSLKDANDRSPIDLFLHMTPPFLQLCRDGRLDAIRALHRHYLFPKNLIQKRGGCSGETPLHEAAGEGHLDVVEFLLDEAFFSVASDECVDWLLRTPLHLAAAGGFTDVVQRLLQQKMDINLADSSHRTALHCALYSEKFETAEFLLNFCEGSLQVNALDKMGHAPMHIAAAAGHARIVELLASKYHAEVDIRAVHTFTKKVRTSGPSMPSRTDRFAFYRHQRQIAAKYVRPRRKRPERPQYDEVQVVVPQASPLWCAVHGGTQSASAAAVLIALGAGRSQNDTVEYIRDLVITALEKGIVECAAPLLKLLGNAVQDDEALLTHFCKKGNHAAVRWLVERSAGARVHALKAGITPIAAASANGHTEVVKYLLANGASPNASTGKETPLLQAIYGNHHAVAHQLAIAGARITPSDGGYELSPIVVAASLGHESILKALLGTRGSASAVVEGATALWAALQNGAVKHLAFSTSASRALKVKQPPTPHESSALALIEGGVVLHEGGPVHVCEVIHLAASKGYFSCIHAIAERLQRLPSDVVKGLLDAAPLPDIRQKERITPQDPTATKSSKAGAARRKKKGKSLHPQTQPFDRYVYTSPQSGIARHRQKLRDAFSFAAEAGEGATITTLLTDVGMSPWSTEDITGRNAADYSVSSGQYDSFVKLVACGVLPLRNHGDGPKSDLVRTILTACGSVKALKPAADEVLHMLLRELCASHATKALQQVLANVLSRHRMTSLSNAGRWSRELLAVAVNTNNTAVTTHLLQTLRVDASLPLKSDTTADPLIGALIHGRFDTVATLVSAGAPVEAPSVIDKNYAKSLAKLLPATAFSKGLRCTPLFIAAVQGDIASVQLLLSKGASPRATDTANNNVLAAAIYGFGLHPTAKQKTIATDLVTELINADATYTSSELLTATVQREMVDAAKVLIDSYGEKVIIKAVEAGADPTTRKSFLHHLLSLGMTDTIISLLFDEERYGTAIAEAIAEEHGPCNKPTNAECNYIVDYALRLDNVKVALGLLAVGCGMSYNPTLSSSNAKGVAIRTAFTENVVLKRNRRGGNMPVAAARHKSGGSLLVHHLLECHALVQERSGKGWNYLHAAAACGHTKLIKTIFELPRNAVIPRRSSADSDESGANHTALACALTKDHESPLSLALRHRNSDVALLLLQNISIRDGLVIHRHAPSAAFHAVVNDAMASSTSRNFGGRDIEWIETFASHGGQVSELIDMHSADHKAFLSERHAFSKLLLLDCNNQRSCTLKAVTPITLATLMSSTRAVTALLSRGARADCLQSVTSAMLPSLHLRRQTFSPDGDGKSWIVSPDPENLPHNAVEGTGGQFDAPLKRGEHTTPGKFRGHGVYPAPLDTQDGVFILAPVVAALATLVHCSQSRKRQTETHRCLEVLNVLLRAGGLRNDQVSLAAIVAVKLEQWSLLDTVLEEAKRSHDRNDDRFLRPVQLKHVHPLLHGILGSTRHVLHHAVKIATKDQLMQLLRHCVREDVETAADANGFTIAYHAARRKDTVAMETLLALQVSVDGPCSTKRGWTPLMVASRWGSLDIAALLLHKGNPAAVDMAGNTALMHAVAAGQQEIVELLLSISVDTTAINKAGYTAQTLAALHGQDNIALPLLQHWTPMSTMNAGSTTAIHCACIGGSLKVVDHILASYEGTEVLKKDSFGHSPVYLAWAFGQTAVLRALLTVLQHRTETPMTKIDGLIVDNSSTIRRFGLLKDSLKLAASLTGEDSATGGNRTGGLTTKAVRLALRPGEQLYAPRLKPFRRVKSLLEWFAASNCPVGVRTCADHNIIDDVNALHTAAAAGHYDVVQLLVSLDMSDVNALDDKKRTAFDAALLSQRERCAAYLLEHMPMTPELLSVTDEETGQNLLHRIAASRCPTLLPLVISRAMINHANPTAGSETILAALLQEDEQKLTPFEISLLVGNPAMVLRIGAAIQQLGGATGRKVSVPVSGNLINSIPILSPAVRVILFDIFDFHDVSSSIGFEMRTARHRRRHTFKRLGFSEVRLIGIDALRRDRLCAARHDEVFTIDHERTVFQTLIQQLELKFRLKFRFDSIKHLLPQQQVGILQRLSSSLLVGRYSTTTQNSCFSGAHHDSVPAGSVEIEYVKSKSDVGIYVEGGVLFERFTTSSKGVFVTGEPKTALEEYSGETAARRKVECEESFKKATEHVRVKAMHPLMRHIRVSCDFACTQDPDGNAKHRLPSVNSMDAVLGFRGLGHFLHICLPKIDDLLQGCNEDQLKSVASTSSLAIHNIIFRYDADYDAAEEREMERQAAFEENRLRGDPNSVAQATRLEKAYQTPSSGEVPSPDIIVLFNAHSFQDIDRAMAPLYNVIQRDAVLVQVHRIRDRFVAKAHKELGLTYKFKLEVESIDVCHLNCAHLRELLNDYLEAMKSLLLPHKKQVEKDAKRKMKKADSPDDTDASNQALEAGASDGIPADSDDKKKDGSIGVKSSCAAIVGNSLVNVRAVLVLLSTKRPAMAKRNDSKAMLCFNPDLRPTRSDILEAMHKDTVSLEEDRLKETLPTQLNDLAQRLNTYLPSASLVLDMPSITHRAEPAEVLSALSLLLHNRSQYVLQTLIQGVSVGWDSRLGGVVRRNVKEVAVVLTTDRTSNLVLLPGGNLIYYASLLCVQRGVSPSSALLSAQQIASQLIIALEAIHPEVREYVDTHRAFACWCKMYGKSLRTVVAGDSRCSFTINACNIINRKCKTGGDTFDVVGRLNGSAEMESFRIEDKQNGSYRVDFSAPSVAGTAVVSASLHGHRLQRCPIMVNVVPGVCHPGFTTVESTFNTVVVDRPFILVLQTHDQFKNARRTSPGTDFVVDGPPATNVEGIKVLSCTDHNNGKLSVRLTISKPSKSAAVGLRVREGHNAQVLGVNVEVLDEKSFEQVIKVKSGKPLTVEKKRSNDRVNVYFRKTVQKAENDRREKESKMVGGVDEKKFPVGYPTSFSAYNEKQLKKKKSGKA